MAGVLPPNPNDPRVIRTRQLILGCFHPAVEHHGLQLDNYR